ncbi:MAG: hypothetical protein HY904_25930 [Deltaproteobacteria bacterium]|nr:hypothetical protein [Deltaproteobacteria bacterium]
MRPRALLPGTVLLLALGVMVGARAAAPGTGPFAGAWEPVVLRGAAVTVHRNRPVAALALLAARDGALAPIPFQVDERTRAGGWCLESASPSAGAADGRRAQGDESPGLLDADDELAFMPADLGARVGAAALAAYAAAEELTVTDPRTGETAWAYLVSTGASPPRSAVRHVRFQPQPGLGDLVATPVFRIGFVPGNAVVPSLLTVGNGDNLLDQLHMRIHARLLGVLPISRDESDLRSHLGRYTAGPVRVLREVLTSVRLVGSLHSPDIPNVSIHTRDSVVLSFRLDVPFPPAGVAQDATFTALAGLRPVRGWRARASSDPRWLSIDGRTDEVEASAQRVGAVWVALQGPDAAVVLAHRGLPPELTAALEYVDTAEGAGVGFGVTGAQHLLRGSFSVQILAHVLDGPRPADELLAVAAAWDRPLHVEVRTVR